MSKEIYVTYEWLLMFFALFLLSGCASGITGESLRGGQENRGTAPVFIDVRTRGEYDRGHIPGSVHIPVLSLPFNMKQIPVSSRREKVVVYCAHGPRAGLAGFFLTIAGFTNVYHLRGDFAGWRKSGYPVSVKSSRE